MPINIFKILAKFSVYVIYYMFRCVITVPVLLCFTCFTLYCVICKKVEAVAPLSLCVMEGAVWRPSNDVMVILTVQMALMSFFVPVSKRWTVYVCPFVLFF